jgi:peptidoglycan/LPS O-acetylase OafA/YrhL
MVRGSLANRGRGAYLSARSWCFNFQRRETASSPVKLRWRGRPWRASRGRAAVLCEVLTEMLGWLTLIGMTSTGEVSDRRPALDALRGVAVLLVMCSHAQLPVPSWGAVGVTIFFTLSGYLITDLLLREQRLGGGRIDLRRFFYRRALRLLPALLAMLAAVSLASLFVPGYVEPEAVLGTLFYFQNWLMANGSHQYGALGHAWSLSVEEQFYFLWPLVLLGVARAPRAGLRLAVLGAVASFLLGGVLWDAGQGPWRVYNGLDTRAATLLIGCALAYLARAVRPQVRYALVGIGAGLVLLFLGMPASQPAAIFLLLPAGVALGTACLIGGLPRGDSTPRVLAWFGTRSYGLYLWNWPVAALLIREGAPTQLVALGVFTAPLLLAELSWRYIETPARRLGAGSSREQLHGSFVPPALSPADG